eukprot:scaffold100418_cov54-Phaeocystis_antarctica.AAC.2
MCGRRDALHEDVRGALRGWHLGQGRRHLLAVQVVAAALALRLEHVGFGRVERRAHRALHLGATCLVEAMQPGEAAGEHRRLLWVDEARQHRRRRQHLLHLLGAREVLPDGGALDREGALDEQARGPLGLSGVVVRGVTRAEVGHAHLVSPQAQRLGVTVELPLPLHLLERSAAQRHAVRRPQLMLETTLVDDVALVRLHDHEDHRHARHWPAGRGADPVGLARARRDVRCVRLRDGRCDLGAAPVGRQPLGVGQRHRKRGLCAQRGAGGTLRAAARQQVAVEACELGAERDERNRDRVELDLQQARRRLLGGLVHHVVGAVDAELQRLGRALRLDGLRYLEQPPGEGVVRHDRAHLAVGGGCVTERTWPHSQSRSRLILSTSRLKGAASAAACAKSDDGNGYGSSESGACANGPSAPSSTPEAAARCSVSVRRNSAASAGSPATATLARFAAGSGSSPPPPSTSAILSYGASLRSVTVAASRASGAAAGREARKERLKWHRMSSSPLPLLW